MTARRSRRAWPWLLVLFLLSWLVSAFLTLPLASVAPHVDLPEGVTLESPRGTVWDGQVILRWQNRPPVEVTLRFRPASLLRLALAWQVSARSTGVTGQAQLRLPLTRALGSHLELSDATLEASMGSPWVEELASSLPMMGRMRLTMQEWHFLPQLEHGLWRLDWSNAGFRLSDDIAFGSVTGQGKITEGRIEGTIQSSHDNSPSTPRLDLRIRQATEGSLLLEGEIDPRGDQNLQKALTLVGRPTTNGKISIRQVIAIR